MTTNESNNTLNSCVQVRVAATEEELQHIYSFRYSVYCVELMRDYPEADHEKKWIRDHEDAEDYAVNIYVSRKKLCDSSDDEKDVEIIGAARLLVWQPGQVPCKYSDMFSLASFPDSGSIVIAELGRLMVSPSARGGEVFKKLIQAVNDTLDRFGCELCFLYCVPGLVKYYRQTLGAYPYNAGHFVEGGSSVGIEMVMFVGNKYDVRNIEHLLEFGQDGCPVELDEDAIWTEFCHKLHLGQSGNDNEIPSFLEYLPENTLKKLMHSSLILKMKRGDVITKEGTEERELYVILDGSFDVHRGNKASKEHLAVLKKGDVFGEIAFFSVSGRRSADVEALTDGEVLVLKHSFLKDLTVNDPEASWQVLFYLGRVLSERVIETSNELVSSLRKQSMLADMNSSHTEMQASAEKRNQLARRATVRL
jgi:CRP-like cAMP-binding protein/predicted GNAT family N-acyltransferase